MMISNKQSMMMIISVVSMIAGMALSGSAIGAGGQLEYRIPNTLLHEFISRMQQQQDSVDSYNSNLDSYFSKPSSSYSNLLNYPELNNNVENYRIRKDSMSGQHDDPELMNHYHLLQTRDDILLPREPVPRKEFLEHSSLYGHQYVQGGAGEGQQRLKPDGSISNVQVIKSDSVLPAYCNPPNPCPNGYTAEDGCLEDFDNSADFSKEYQSSQECMCDSEHMFNCPGNSDENELETLARSIQNEGLTLDNTLNHIMDTMDKNHKVVAKKYFIKRSGGKTVTKRSVNQPPLKSHKENPFLMGEKLPVVAKKAPHLSGRI